MRGLKNNSIEILRYHIDWNAFFDLVRDVGDQLDERKNRFDKSDVLEMALEEYSDGEIKWVDDIGCDHEILTPDETLEMKTQKGCLYTPKRKQRKTRTKNIKLTNTLAASVETTMNVNRRLAPHSGHSDVQCSGGVLWPCGRERETRP